MARIPQTIAVGKIHIIQPNMMVSYFDEPVIETASEEWLKELAGIHRTKHTYSSNLWYDDSPASYMGFGPGLSGKEKAFRTDEKSWGKTQLPWFVPITQLTKYGNAGLYYIKALFEDKFVWFTRLGAHPIPYCFSRIKTEAEEKQFIKVNDRKNKKED